MLAHALGRELRVALDPTPPLYLPYHGQSTTLGGEPMPFIDLSHPLENGMPGFRLKNEQGGVTEFSIQIRPFITHEQSRPRYHHQAEFEITEMTLHTSIGTYLDSPYHRHRNRRDISQLDLSEVILPGVLIDARGYGPFSEVGPEVLPAHLDISGKAVLFHFGWDAYWGTEQYYSYPFLSQSVITTLLTGGAKLVGMDTLNADDSRNPTRPTHTLLLQEDVLILENLTGLEPLYGNNFRFFAVPLKVTGAAAMSVRAFAEILS